jgi:hypothetical protein
MEDVWSELLLLLKAKLLTRSFCQYNEPIPGANGMSTRGNRPVDCHLYPAFNSPSGYFTTSLGSHNRPNIAKDRTETVKIIRLLARAYWEMPEPAQMERRRVMKVVGQVFPYFNDRSALSQKLLAAIPTGDLTDKRYLIESQCYMLLLMAISSWEFQSSGVWPEIPTIAHLNGDYTVSVFDVLLQEQEVPVVDNSQSENETQNV